MASVRELHNLAMTLAQQAMVAREAGNLEEAGRLAREAFEVEAQAADILEREEASEPTRSILYRSAASLAFQAKDFAAAQRLVAKGLAGYPPADVEVELKDLYETINFEHHLDVRGVELNPEDLQVALQGDVVGAGTVLYSEFLKRLEHTKSLLERTVERLLGREYRIGGKAGKDFQPFIPAITVPRQGSFAISFKLVTPKDAQLSLLVSPKDVINEILESVDLVNSNDLDSLKERFNHNDSYLRNFVSLITDMAPDGERINFVGFTSRTKKVSLIKSRNEIKDSLSQMLPQEITERRPIEVIGRLDFAIARNSNVIELTTQEDVQYKVLVNEGMEDLVKRYFGSEVAASGLYDGKYIYLSDLREA